MPPPGERDDAALVAATLAGDNTAFSALMVRHKSQVYGFIRRYVGDAGEALDLVQETFVACWSGLDTFDASRSFPAWLRRIALNKCRDWSRRRKVRQFFFAAAPLTADLPDGEKTAPDDPDPTRLAALDRAIAALPATLKEPLLLTMFEELSHQQAASLLGVTAKAIETRLYRAKQHLRRALDDAGSG